MKYEAIIYRATFKNSESGKCYIGQSIHYEERKYGHIRSSLNKNSHDYNSTFHCAIRKYGVENLVWDMMNVSACCLLNKNSAYGYIWRYADNIDGDILFWDRIQPINGYIDNLERKILFLEDLPIVRFAD